MIEKIRKIEKAVDTLVSLNLLLTIALIFSEAIVYDVLFVELITLGIGVVLFAIGIYASVKINALYSTPCMQEGGMHMLKLLLVLILSPVIILGATLLVCSIIAAGFDVVVKMAIISAILCGVRFVFAKCKEIGS